MVLHFFDVEAEFFRVVPVPAYLASKLPDDEDPVGTKVLDVNFVVDHGLCSNAVAGFQAAQDPGLKTPLHSPAPHAFGLFALDMRVRTPELGAVDQ